MWFKKNIFIGTLIFTLVVFFQNCGDSPYQSRKPSNLENSQQPFADYIREFPSQQIPNESTDAVLSATSSGKTYYVSKSGSNTDGLSKATAFTTIQKAANLAKAGDKVVVAPGIYKEYVKNSNHGTASSRIRFVSEVRWAAKIAPTQGALHYWLSSGSYVDIEGFTFDGKLGGALPSFKVRGIQINGNASRVMYNNIRLYRACTPELFYRTGIGISSMGYETNFNSEIFGNIIQNTKVTGCALPPRIDKDPTGGTTYHYDETAGYGIYLATPKAKAYNNIIFGFRIGIHLWHNPTANLVAHNLIFDTGNVREGYRGVGIIFGCGDAPYTTCENIIVANNILMNNRGAQSIRETGKNVIGSNRVLNNLLFNNISNAIVTGKDVLIPMVMGVSGNLLNIDPKLVNFQINGTGDYRLTGQSPAINKASANGGVAIDINKGVRPLSSDVGPYEYGVTGSFPVSVSTALLFLAK